MPRQSHLHLRHLPEAWIELVQNMWACPLSCLQLILEFEMKMINEIRNKGLLKPYQSRIVKSQEVSKASLWRFDKYKLSI